MQESGTPTLRVRIYEGERYPDYDLDIVSNDDKLFDALISQDLFDRWTAARQEYAQVQRILKDLYRKPEQ